MRQLQAFALLGVAAHTGNVVATSAPRGVGPEFVKFYDIKDLFQCIGQPAISISSSQVNDNSCDCPDGSDEPGTAACALLDPLSPEQPFPSSLSGTTNTTTTLPGFWCANKGHIGAYVPFQFVNDGVCDYEICCDGSEEYGNIGGVMCPDKCDEIGKEWRRVDKERRDNLERANKKRRTMAKESMKLRHQIESKVSSLAAEVQELETKESQLKDKLDEIEHQERGKVVKGGEGPGKLGVLVGLAKTRINELRDTLGQVVSEQGSLNEKIAELEGILLAFKEEYNPNFNDEGVKKAVRGWEDYAARKAEESNVGGASQVDISSVLKEDGPSSGINWAEFDDDEVTDTDILYSFEAYLPGPLRNYVSDKLASARLWMIENGILADSSSVKAESKLVKAAREAHKKAGDNLRSKHKALDKEKKDLETDYGTDDIFRVLKGKCVSVESGEYTYELCWMEKTSQKSKKGHAGVTMGKYERIEWGEADEEERVDGKSLGVGRRMVLKYENGQHCWNGPNRRTDVWLTCAEKEELWRVSEMEKCVYKMEVGTPAVCEETVEPGERTRDEL